jgi:hypothetical protein
VISEVDWRQFFEEFSLAASASALELQLVSAGKEDFVRRWQVDGLNFGGLAG